MKQRDVDQLNAQERKKTYRDDGCPGLFVLVHASGTKRYFLRYSWEGRQDSVTIGDTSEMSLAEARDIALDHKYHLRRGVPPKQRYEKLSMAEGLERWMAEQEVSKNTRLSYRSKIETHILPAMGTKDVRRVHRADVVKLHRSLIDKPSTANVVLAVLKGFFAWAQDAVEGLEATPVVRIKAFKTKGRERALSAEERVSLLDALSACANQEFADAVRLILITGSRKSEIVDAVWDGVEMERGVLRFDGKTGQTTRFLSAPAKQILSRRPTREGKLFPTLTHSVVYRAWAKLIEEAGIEDLKIHDLRHDFASVAAAKTGDIHLVSKLLGHKSISSTERYTHLFDDPQQQAMDRIAEEYDIGTATEGAKIVLEGRWK
jgi:integrase